MIDEEPIDDEIRQVLIVRNVKTKSFIKVGETYVDIKHCYGFSFVPNPEGYLYFVCSSIYDITKVTAYPINDRNQLSLLFLELETFFDDENLLTSITALINEVDSMAMAEIEYMRRRKSRRKRKKDDKSGE